MTHEVDFWQDAGVFLTHMRMLSNDDLQAIGTIVDEKLDKKLDEKLEPILEAIQAGFEDTATKDDLAAVRGEMADMRHELMDHTDRTVAKAVGDLRSELRERNIIA